MNMNATPNPNMPYCGEHSLRARNNLYIDNMLLNFIDTELLAGTGISSEHFWESLEILVKELGPVDRALLGERRRMQRAIDDWHRNNRFEPQAYSAFLEDIGYLLPEPEGVQVATTNVDPEIATTAAPQLVVPVQNARFALNAANARWGSLYDALYGSDAIAGDIGSGYDPRRGGRVIARGRSFLDEAAPLQQGSHGEAVGYQIDDSCLWVTLDNGQTTLLWDESLFVGYCGDPKNPDTILLRHNGLHIEIQFDPQSQVGANDPAHISDIVLESAVTTIQDLEDSVAAVDGEDKTVAYRNMLGLYRGDLSAQFFKDGQVQSRALDPDRNYLNPEGQEFTLPGRSLLLMRNVGFLMTTPAVRDEACCEIPEGILDALVTAVAAMHDLNKPVDHPLRNSKTGSVYIVKPKMHGPKEVAFCCRLFARVEQLLGLPHNTLKLGIMDEERRTTLNLKACIQAASERVIFINTGFLDRTGDEIHTSMEAGPMVPKDAMKTEPWLDTYERWNVATGLQCGLAGVAQIGKGMWPKPDDMADMLATKMAHLEAGASCAWVPSPTAATLHAMHYHQVNVRDCQRQLSDQLVNRQALLQIPLLKDTSTLSAQQIQRELDNNAQGILGYVVRWVDQGIGCSKVPDIDNVALMEDRATLRISSQHIANWLRHGICSAEQVTDTFANMAAVVDRQNSHDINYRPMAADLENNLAYQSALALVFQGCEQPNGYTEPLLHHYRLLVKKAG
ncbi:malate synthase G [Porticoccus sp. GXU_MW_L64]